MLEYYDRIIVAIGASVVAGVVLGVVTPLALDVGLFLGGLAATVFLYDAMFRNPPVPPADPRVATTAVVWHAILLSLAISVYVG
ncbi:hypothetical protein [Natronosalvus rutilus]|uniref:Uncharacterized protein n=1 Tax=Natronosalvus rutilus TaxID=2953753 RepID=A0A9E7N983_9EURY|nr:hypothetical protein [Natronosalvus rutilus]UTF53775.1 hypothetical protein NGM29_00350 [Natronosalvus rutilus]